MQSAGFALFSVKKRRSVCGDTGFDKKIKNGMYDETLKDIYVDKKKIVYEIERYIKAIESYTEHFGEGEVFVFSAPGRSEIGGNHTDHQCGEGVFRLLLPVMC